MEGWNFSSERFFRQTNQILESLGDGHEQQHSSDDKLSSLLASWDAEVSNIRWLRNLVSDGKAKQHLFSGYPNRFTAKASDILPVIGQWLHSPGDGVENVTIYSERIAEITDDHVLTIDLWDKS